MFSNSEGLGVTGLEAAQLQLETFLITLDTSQCCLMLGCHS